MTLIAVIADPHFDDWDRSGLDPIRSAGLDASLKERSPDLLVIAGDISNNPLRNWPGALGRIGTLFPPERVVIVPGNHDYYGFQLDNDPRLRELCSSAGMRFAQKDEIRIGLTRILCCTLWTDFALIGNPGRAMNMAGNVMNDYNRIMIRKDQNRRFNELNARMISPRDTLSLHLDHRRWLTDALRAPHFAGERGRTVIVTHHGPSPQTTGGPVDDLTPSFHSDLDDLILETGPDAWFFGHSHRRCRVTLGRTDIRCVSIGYSDEQRGHRLDLPEIIYFDAG
jgi:predicted phosphohydrolase